MSSLPARVNPGVQRAVGALILGSLVGFAGKRALCQRQPQALNLRQNTVPPLQNSDEPTQRRQLLTSQGPRQVQCSLEQVNRDEDGMYLPTKTDPPFLMNIHDPKEDQGVSMSIEAAGVFEGHLVNEVTSALTDAGPGSAFIDIGSNIGMYALAAAAKGHDVVAFEPFQVNWKRICNSVNANPGFERHVSLYSNAVVETPGLVEFGPVSMSNPGHVVANEVSNEVMAQDVSQLKAGADVAEGVDYAWGVRLDWMQDLLPRDRPIVMKLDIEGGECRALSGSLEYIAKADLVYLQMEVMSDAFLNCPRVQEVIDLLVMKGLTPHLYNAASSRSKVLDHRDYINWFADPNFVIGDIVWKKVEHETTFLTFGASITWGAGMVDRYKAYPFLLSSGVTNLAMRASGPVYPSLCTQSMVGDSDEPYDVIILEYHLPIQGFTLLARRLRQRFPNALMIIIRYWYPYQVYNLSPGVIENARKWSEKNGHGGLHDSSFQDALMNSEEEWLWADNTDTYREQDEAAKEVGAHIVALPKPSDPKQFVNYADWFCNDWLHLSEAGHAFVAQGIQHIVDTVGVVPNPQLGTWGGGDSCMSWFQTGESSLPHSDNIEMELFNSEHKKYALKIPGQGFIRVTNPSTVPLELSLSYMATGPAPSKYPKTMVSIGGIPENAVLLDPIAPPEFGHTVHVSVTTSVGMLQPGENTVYFEPVETTEYPFRLISTTVTGAGQGDFGPFFRGDNVISRTSDA